MSDIIKCASYFISIHYGNLHSEYTLYQETSDIKKLLPVLVLFIYYATG